MTAEAANVDSIYQDRHSLWRQTREESLRNPALMTHAYQKSFTELDVKTDYRKQTDAFCMEEGTGLFIPEVAARSFIRLTRSSVVWGQAAYANGKQYNKVYNNVADFNLLYPDIIADSLGGDTHRERYLFSGGYAAERGKWHLGGELKFRAEQEFRTYDPRMRSVVSDLTLRAGVGRVVGKYTVGIWGERNIYRQTADVDFYGEANGMGELQMTGLGTSYVRFSGSNRDIFYQGKGGTLAADIVPKSENGWFGHLSWGMYQYERLSDEYNSMPLTTLYRQQRGLTVGWKQQAERKEKAFMIHATYDKRASDEHIAGSASGQDYPILTSLTMYKQHVWDINATALYGQSQWRLLMRAGFLNHRESYAYVERKIEYARVYGDVTAQWLTSVRKDLKLNLFGKAGYEGNVSHKILMPYANMTLGIKNYIQHNYKYQKASYAHVQAGARADYKREKWMVGIYGQLATAWQFCSEGEHESNLYLAIGIVF